MKYSQPGQSHTKRPEGIDGGSQQNLGTRSTRAGSDISSSGSEYEGVDGSESSESSSAVCDTAVVSGLESNRGKQKTCES